MFKWKKTYSVYLPWDQSPIFPNRCVVSNAPNPQAGWIFYGPTRFIPHFLLKLLSRIGFRIDDYSLPILQKYKNILIAQRIIFFVLLLLGLTLMLHSGEYRGPVPIEEQPKVIVGFCILAFLFVIVILQPLPIELTDDEHEQKTRYIFTNKQYAIEFTKLNDLEMHEDKS